jgi:hypothetical protein
MKRHVSVLALFLVAAAAPGLAQTWISGPVDGALAAAKKDNKPVLIDFTQKGG